MNVRSPKTVSKIGQGLFWTINVCVGFLIGYVYWQLGNVDGVPAGILIKLALPTAVWIFCLGSWLRLTHQKRTGELFQFIYQVEFPLLFVTFWLVVLPVFPLSLGVFGVVITLFAMLFWLKLMDWKRLQRLSPLLDSWGIPWGLVMGTGISIWLFVVWMFWAPGVGWAIVRELSLFEFSRSFQNVTMGRFLFMISLVVVGGIFVTSPMISLVTFGYGLRRSTMVQKWKRLGIGLGVLLGVMVVFNFFEKTAPVASFRTAQAIVGSGELTKEKLDQLGNLQLLEVHLKQVYFAQYKYLLSNYSYTGSGTSYINVFEPTLRELYCIGGDKYLYQRQPPAAPVCAGLARVFEYLVFPVYYGGNLEEDQRSAVELYGKLFDSSLVDDNARRIQRLQQSSIPGMFGGRRGVQLTGEEENVWLESVESQTEVHQGYGIYRNVITYTLINQTEDLQEVAIEFSLPDEEAVVTDLRLGRDLQLSSQVAPKGAALQVYNTSRQLQIDPALLQQIGSRTYRLRVFPIPGIREADLRNGDVANDGLQRVQVEITGKVLGERPLEIMGSLSMKNVLVNRKSELKYSVRNELGEIVAEDVRGGNELKRFEDAEVELQFDLLKRVAIATEEVDRFRSVGIQLEIDRSVSLAVFIDSSYSANDSETRRRYREVIQALQEDFETVKLYTFNTEVREVESLDKIEYWGSTDTGALARYLQKQSVYPHVVILTDDSNFEAETVESMSVDYMSLSRYPTEVIQVGEGLKGVKAELMNMVLASEGSTFLVNGGTDLNSVMSNVGVRTNLLWEVGASSDNLVMEPKWREAVEDLYAGHVSRQLLRNVRDDMTWNAVAEEQSVVAARAHIVNSFNSLIALETEGQQRQLDRLKQEEDKYRMDHESDEEMLLAEVQVRRASEVGFVEIVIVLMLLGGVMWGRKSCWRKWR